MGDFNRRTVLAAASLVAATGGTALAQAPGASAPARQKGPRVWLDMDQQELDDAYDQSKYAANLRQVVGRYATNSAQVRERLGAPKRLAYGPTPVEALDLYTAKQPNAPVHIFIHGGTWRTGAAKDYLFPAETFLHAGAHYISLDFTSVLDVKGDLAPMADQVRRAVAWIHKNAASFGGDPNRLYLSGHSSGGHLAGVVLVTDWEKHYGMPKDVLKGGLCCSGMFDMKPVMLSARSNYLKMTDETLHAMSAQRQLDKINCPVIVAYGSLETPEFQRQSRDFAAAAKAAGKPVSLLLAEGYNHFEIIETLANPYGQLGRAALEQMKLAPV
ncbi:MAG TPA: alpha/beta hydrolase [Xanthobacteraceae bacterium]|nr:alpha/beta hydrolase [Xanthobacteraceae bacterium]